MVGAPLAELSKEKREEGEERNLEQAGFWWLGDICGID
jgi:hypothetical protein